MEEINIKGLEEVVNNFKDAAQSIKDAGEAVCKVFKRTEEAFDKAAIAIDQVTKLK